EVGRDPDQRPPLAHKAVITQRPGVGPEAVVAGMPQVSGRPRTPSQRAGARCRGATVSILSVETNAPGPPDPIDAVRCVACGTAYVPPPGSDAACPSCGCAIWVSARPAAEPRRGRAGSA